MDRVVILKTAEKMAERLIQYHGIGNLDSDEIANIAVDIAIKIHTHERLSVVGQMRAEENA